MHACCSGTIADHPLSGLPPWELPTILSQGDDCMDCFAHMCCYPCAFTQEEREIKYVESLPVGQQQGLVNNVMGMLGAMTGQSPTAGSPPKM